MGEKLFAIDNPYVESDAAAPHCRSVNHKSQGLLGKRHQKSTSYGQDIGFKMIGSVVEPSRKPLFPTGWNGSITDLLGHARQLCAEACYDCTDKGCKRGEMLDLPASRVGHELLKRAHNSSKGFL